MVFFAPDEGQFAQCRETSIAGGSGAIGGPFTLTGPYRPAGDRGRFLPIARCCFISAIRSAPMSAPMISPGMPKPSTPLQSRAMM